MTKDTTRPMTAEEYWEEEVIPNIDPFTRPFQFAEAYAEYRLLFEQEQQPQPLDPFEGAPEWAEWRAADVNGDEFFYSLKPSPIANFHITDGFHMRCPDRRLTYSDWEQSPVKRPAR